MTLDEAIRYNDVLGNSNSEYKVQFTPDDYRQLAKMLRELKGYRKARKVLTQKAKHKEGQCGIAYRTMLIDIVDCVENEKDNKGGTL